MSTLVLGIKYFDDVLVGSGGGDGGGLDWDGWNFWGRMGKFGGKSPIKRPKKKIFCLNVGDERVPHASFGGLSPHRHK